MSQSSDNHAQLLGKIEGIVSQMRETQLEHGRKMDGLDTRLRDQETTAAKHGAFAGTAMAIGVALIIEGAKSWLKSGGRGPA